MNAHLLMQKYEWQPNEVKTDLGYKHTLDGDFFISIIGTVKFLVLSPNLSNKQAHRSAMSLFISSMSLLLAAVKCLFL